jgi:hypothetical protein
MALLVLATFLFPRARAAAKTGSQADEAKQTLSEIRASAVAVENEADELRMTIARPDASPESSLSRLMMLKDEVNRMGKEFSTLEAERQSLPEWEQQALDKTLPLLQATAAHTEGAIEYYNENRSHMWTDAGRGYTDRIYDESKQIATTLQNYLRYEKALSKEQRLNREVSSRGSELGL